MLLGRVHFDVWILSPAEQLGLGTALQSEAHEPPVSLDGPPVLGPDQLGQDLRALENPEGLGVQDVPVIAVGGTRSAGDLPASSLARWHRSRL